MQQLQKIDILRGVAILLVFGYHAMRAVFGDYFELIQYNGFLVDFQKVGIRQLLLNVNPIALGHVGVELFLIISGFLIHLVYLRGGLNFEPAKFYNKRFWRIYPPYLVALVVFGLSLDTGGPFSLLTHLTLTHNLFDSTFFTINPSFWSLALEMQLYVLYPLYLVLRKRLGLNKSVLAVAAVSLLTLSVNIAQGGAHSSSLGSLWIVWVLGAYLAENFYYQRRLYTTSPIYLVLGYVLYIALRMTVIQAYIGDILFSLLSIYAIDWYLHQESLSGQLAKKVSQAMTLIGTYSYSIYLFHQPFLREIIALFSYSFIGKGAWVIGVLGAFAFFFVLAFLSLHLLELPSINLGVRFYNKFFAKPKKVHA